MAEPEELGKTAPKTSQMPAKDAPDETHGLPNETAGRYALPEGVSDPELGRGGMGRVLRLHDTHLRRDVAVKELLPQHHPSRSSQGPLLASLFIREARVMAKLDHPCVVPIYELARREDGTPFYSMRRVGGRTLGESLKACASLSDRLTLLSHYLDVVQTIGFAHAHGVVHRDLKPDNVMIGSFGETQVLDWGLAKVEGEADLVGTAAGTPAYMSPEQVVDQGVDARSDVWALGVMLFEVLTGTLPFDGATMSEVLNQVTRGDLPRVVDRERRAPAALVKIVERAMRRDPSARYQTAGEMAEALEAAQRMAVPRVAPWPLVAGASLLAGVVLTVALSSSPSHTTDTASAHDERAALDAKLEASSALAESALLALRAHDTNFAVTRATDALKHGEAPLARGVLLAARERGVPTLTWRAGVTAGCASLAVTGELLACATLNGVELSSLATGKQVGTLAHGPLGWQHAVAALSADRLASGGDDRTLHVWSVSERREVQTVGPFDSGILALSAASDGVLVGLRNGDVVRVSPSGERSVVWTMPGFVRAVAAAGPVMASCGGQLLRARFGDAAPIEVTGDCRSVFVHDGAVYAGLERTVVKLSKSGVTQVSSAARDVVTAMAWGTRLVSGDAEGSLRWWFDDSSADGAMQGYEPGVVALATLEGTNTVFIAPRERALYRLELPVRAAALPESATPTVHAYWGDTTMLSGLSDGHLRRYDVKTGEVALLESRHVGAVRALAPLAGPAEPNGLRHLSGGDDGRVLAQTWNGEVTELDKGLSVTAVAVTSDAQRAAWAFADGTVVLWSLHFNKEIARSRESLVHALAFSADSRTLAAGREDKRVALLSAETGAVQRMLQETDGPVLGVAWAGTQLISVGAEARLTAWDTVSGAKVRESSNMRDKLLSVAVNAAGTLVAAGSADGFVYVYEAKSWALQAVIPADAGDVVTVHFVDLQTLFGVGQDRVPHVWKLSQAAAR